MEKYEVFVRTPVMEWWPERHVQEAPADTDPGEVIRLAAPSLLHGYGDQVEVLSVVSERGVVLFHHGRRWCRPIPVKMTRLVAEMERPYAGLIDLMGEGEDGEQYLDWLLRGGE